MKGFIHSLSNFAQNNTTTTKTANNNNNCSALFDCFPTFFPQESIRSSEEGATFASVPFDYNSLNAASSSTTGSGSEAYDPHEATASNDATENEEEEEDDDDEEEEEDEPFYVPEILKCPPGMTVCSIC